MRDWRFEKEEQLGISIFKALSKGREALVMFSCMEWRLGVVFLMS